jgi:hypothetical protein
MTQRPELVGRSSTPSSSGGRIDWNSIGRFSPTEILPLRHHLADEPLLSMESLRKLANRMYARKEVRFKPPEPTDLFISNDQHSDGWSIDEVFDRLEQPGSWMAIYHLTSDPEYADLCRSLLAEIDRHIGSIDPGLHGADLAIFLSSGPTETPYHIDQHPVFFFQLKGRKLMNLWDSRDPEVVPPQLAEEFLCERREGLFRYQEAFQSKVMEFELAPGDGLYWPATTPHYVRTQSYWAKPGDGVSLSFNISYYTKATRRRFCISTLNRILKQRTSIRPIPFGVSPLRDSLKYPFGRAYLLAHRLLKGQYLHPDQKL